MTTATDDRWRAPRCGPRLPDWPPAPARPVLRDNEVHVWLVDLAEPPAARAALALGPDLAGAGRC